MEWPLIEKLLNEEKSRSRQIMSLSFRKELISQMPALRPLMALGYRYLQPSEALALRGNGERWAGKR